MTGRTALFCAGLAALLALLPGTRAAAIASDRIEQLRIFATCAGRMMALRDHLALFGSDGIDAAEARRAQHIAVLEALTEDARDEGFDPRRALHWRIDARAAQSAVLTRSSFGTTQAARDSATAASDRHIAFCDRLILGA